MSPTRTRLTISLGGLVGNSEDYWGLCNYAARVNKTFSTGRIFVDDGAPGQYCLVVEDYLSPQLLEADNAIGLLWQAIGILQQHAKDARDAASALEGFNLADQSSESYATLTLQFI